MNLKAARGLCWLGAVVLAAAGLGAQSAPSGRDVLDRMRAAYAGKWFRTLTFVQKTTIVRADGTRTEQTWFESLRSPGTLRIDVAPLADGNGSLNLPDKVIVVRGGQVAQTRPAGNPFLPFVAGIYTQPLEDTIAQLGPQGYDLTKTHVTDVLGRRIIVVGTATRGDLSVPQFWVDAERLIATRVLLRSATVGSSLLDVALEGYAPSGQSWVATHVTMSVDGAVRQVEEYSDVKTDVDLPDDLFDPAKWMTAPHWARRP
jgi:hypothetical protein